MLAIVLAIAWRLPLALSSPAPTPAPVAQEQHLPVNNQKNSEQNLTTNGSDQQRHSRQKHHKEGKQRTSRWEKMIAKGTVAIAAFTLLLILATILLYWGGEKNSRTQLRAYLSVTPMWLFLFNRNTPRPIFIEAVIRNHRQSPAHGIRNIYEIGVFPPNFQTPEHATQQRDAEGTAFPGIDLSVRFFDNKTFSQQEMTDVLAGTRLIFVWGTVTYRDIFRHRWQTDFSAHVGGEDFANWIAGHAPPPRWVYGNRHNRST